MNDVERRKKIKEFIGYWDNKVIGERKEYQNFWNMFLQNILEVSPYGFIEYEKPVLVEKNTKFIDGYIKGTRVLIEQKGSDIDLDKEELQSGGIKLTPAEQARRYVKNLSFDDRARWMVVSNFKEIRIFDMNKTGSDYEIIKLKDLEKEWYRLKFLVDVESNDIKKEMEISVEAGRLVGKLYDALIKEYKDISKIESQRSLNILCVRIVFCLYAEDAGIFDGKQKFHDYLKSFKEENFREALINLFKILNEKDEDRDKYLNEKLLSFPYVNGGLFKEENIEIPKINSEIIDLIQNKMSENFDWAKISPTIFGAIFESTLNPTTRRAGGMHYTSIENIHKVIDPLFLNDLKNEFENIKEIKQKNKRDEKLKEFRDKLSNLRFLDPAAGSGNFLTETYISLRKIENEILKLLYTNNDGSIVNALTIDEDVKNIIKVSIGNFYGIEINDFAVVVSNTALWIAEYQMLKETEDILCMQIDYLPLKSYNHIVEGNALTIDWKNTFKDANINYIMGNPPFVGWGLQSSSQREDMEKVFIYKNGNRYNNAKKLDYVASWYIKTAQYIQNTNIECAFVSTNSITQGEQVSPLWKFLIEEYNIKINFAYKTFVWNSESNEEAKVHCVIIGFSILDNKLKIINDNGKYEIVENINPYLINAPTIFIDSISTSLCGMPLMRKGNQPTDGGNLILTEEEYCEFKIREPQALQYIKELVGGQEFIKGIKRYCLWLVNIEPKKLKLMPLTMERVKRVREMRLKSSDEGTRKMADKPTTFRETMNPESYIIIPKTSSFKRRYIPMGLLNSNSIPIDTARIIIGGNLYHFGILTSNVHMAWMRRVCGRLKSDYSYSNTLVYNNFPWPIDISKGEKNLKDFEKKLIKIDYPTMDKEQKNKIEETAKQILEARKEFKDSSLADLYDETIMPDILRKAHRENDKLVMRVYNFKISHTEFTEEDCVGALMKLYKEIIDAKK